jgi:hypothetical protein
MDCLHSMAPSDEEILRYVLDGEPLAGEAGEHIKSCSICQHRLACYAHTEKYLIARLYRSECPSAMELNLFCASMLAPDEAEYVAGHIEYCPLCRQEMQNIQDMLATFDSFPAYLSEISTDASFTQPPGY